MYLCKTISCTHSVVGNEDYCPSCINRTAANDSAIGFQTETGTVLHTQSAADFLRAGLGHMDDRAASYDNPEGERSMAKTVRAFNIFTGHNLTETEGWKFMECLKMARSCQGDYKADTYEDRAAYAALAGESHAKEDSLECEH